MNLGNIPNRIISFLKEVRLEIKKVNWPSRDQTIRYTVIVVIGSIIVAIYLGGLDFILSTLLNRFVL